jgi:repressor LexA
VADNLKKYRREKGMTQKELADEINKNLGTNFKHNTISSWENGTNSIDTTILKLICDILEIDINTIYGGETKKPTTTAAHLPEGVELTEEEQKQLLSLKRVFFRVFSS